MELERLLSFPSPLPPEGPPVQLTFVGCATECFDGDRPFALIPLVSGEPFSW